MMPGRLPVVALALVAAAIGSVTGCLQDFDAFERGSAPPAGDDASAEPEGGTSSEAGAPAPEGGADGGDPCARADQCASERRTCRTKCSETRTSCLDACSNGNCRRQCNNAYEDCTDDCASACAACATGCPRACD